MSKPFDLEAALEREESEREALRVIQTRRAAVVEEMTQIAEADVRAQGGELRSRQVRALIVAVANYIVELEGRIERLEGGAR